MIWAPLNLLISDLESFSHIISLMKGIKSVPARDGRHLGRSRTNLRRRSCQNTKSSRELPKSVTRIINYSRGAWMTTINWVNLEACNLRHRPRTPAQLVIESSRPSRQAQELSRELVPLQRRSWYHGKWETSKTSNASKSAADNPIP